MIIIKWMAAHHQLVWWVDIVIPFPAIQWTLHRTLNRAVTNYLFMPVIRITDTTRERLKKQATPLEDSPEDAVRKILDAAEEHCKDPQTHITEKHDG